MKILACWALSIIMAPAFWPGISFADDFLSLDRAIELGLPNHPRLQAAKGNIDAARGAFWQTVSPENPELSVENEQIPRGLGLSDYQQQNIGISQTIEFPLVTYLKGKSARLSTQAARASYDLTIARIKAEITEAYISLWLSSRRVILLDSLASTAERLALITRKRQAIGDATTIESDRLVVQSEQAAIDRDQAQMEFRLAGIALGQLIGREVSPETELDEPLLPKAESHQKVYSENSAAVVQQASLLTKAARMQYNAAKLSWLPRIELRVFKQAITGEHFWGGEVGFSIPLWIPFGGRGNQLAARGTLALAEAERELTSREWNLGIVEARESYEIAAQRLKSYAEIILPASRRAYSASVRSYEVGELNLTDLLSSFLQERSAETDYLNAIGEAWQWKTKLDVITAKSAESQ